MSQKIYFEGLTLTVENVDRSIAFYEGLLGFHLEHNAAPHFALIRVSESDGGTIGLLAIDEAEKDGVEKAPRSKSDLFT